MELTNKTAIILAIQQDNPAAALEIQKTLRSQGFSYQVIATAVKRAVEGTIHDKPDIVAKWDSLVYAGEQGWIGNES